MMILCRLFCQGFLGLFSSLFPSLLFFIRTPFFSSQEKKKVNIVYLFFSFFLSLSLSLSFADASILNARAREGERERAFWR
jgi:hypothetical protein